LPPPASLCRFGRFPSAKPPETPSSRQLARPLLIFRAGFSREVTAMADNTLFGIHGAALEVRGQRMGVLASNIANASTPGFKARDIDFQQALSSATSPDGLTDNGLASATKYRVPLQPSLDGNTVDLSTEQTAFAENAVQYQTTLSFLNGRIGQITRALRGE
jgi:flagellar basal-body rod protein FlgB